MKNKNCYNEYTAMNDNGSYLMDKFKSILDDELKKLFHEGYSRSDIMYAMITSADYTLITESSIYATKKRIEDRKNGDN